jgi:outer membrane protein OmpA-like peptidoglycan-associated protein
MSLLKSLTGMLGNEVVGGLASHLGESNDGVNKAMGGIFPSLLGSLMNSKQEDHSMLGGLLSQAGNLGGDNIASSLLSGLLSGKSNEGLGGIGSSLVSGLLGNKMGGVVDLISNVAGVKSSSSNSLLSMGGSLLASYLGKKMISDKLNFGGILNMLSGHKNEISAAAPSGISSLLGLGNIFSAGADKVSSAASAVTGAAGKATETVASYGNNDDNKGGGMKWLLPLLLLGVLGAGLWYFMKGKKSANEGEATTIEAPIDATANTDGSATGTDATAGTAEGTSTVTTTDAAAATATTTATATDASASTATSATATADPNAGKTSSKIKLTNGTEINAYKGGVEEKLVAFLNDPASKLAGDADKSKDWFDFDNLNFDLGKATITKASMVQIDNLAAILKAYPKMKIKVGGYTDKVGDDAKNLKLSQDRADAVFAALKAKGSNAGQLVKAEGYGETLAKVAETASDAERRADRRTAVRILEK